MCIFLNFFHQAISRLAVTCGGAIHAPLRLFDYALELWAVVTYVFLFTDCCPQLFQSSGVDVLNLPFVYVHADIIPVWRAWYLLEGGKESIKVFVTVRHKQDVQAGPWAVNRRRSAVPTETTNHSRADAVAVPDLHIVILTRMVEFQAEHHEPVIKETRLLTEVNAKFYLSFKL